MGLAAFFLNPNQAQAATLTVSSGCTLPEAIAAINDAADSGGPGCTASGAYGTNDTINIPSGTTSVSDNLPDITKSLTINGTSINDSIVNLTNNSGFRTDYSAARNTKNLTIKNLSITQASPYAIDADGVATIILENLDISSSVGAVRIVNSEKITIKNSVLHDNADPTSVTDGVGTIIGLGSITAGKDVEYIADGLKILNNSGQNTGMYINPQSFVFGSGDTQLIGTATIKIHNSVVMNNQSRYIAGIVIVSNAGPVSPTLIDLSVDATTVANNSVTVDTPQIVNNAAYLPVVSGFMITGVLTSAQHFKNVTVAYNTVNNPAPDNRNSVAGFIGSLGINGNKLDIINTTVVGNSVTQPAATLTIPAFFATKIGLNESFEPNSVESGSTATNVLVAQNKFNGLPFSCASSADATKLGLSNGTVDVTPINLGFNLSDDQTCTGYKYVSNLYETIAHEVADNGGPVPTIKLLPGSPAINAGGQVQGISTDARGIVRTGYFSVGAYQGELLAATTTSGNGKLAETGVVMISVGLLALIILSVVLYTYMDYRHHRKPLAQADVGAAIPYTFSHHVRVVTIPLLRYRLSITLKKKPSTISRF